MLSDSSLAGVTQCPQYGAHSAGVKCHGVHLTHRFVRAFMALAARRAGVIEAFETPYCEMRPYATGQDMGHYQPQDRQAKDCY